MSHEEYANYSYKYSNKKDHVPLKNNHEDQYSYSYNYSANKIISGDEKYIANYVGNKYLSIKNSKFSLPTLIFGPLYFIYRKLFLYGLLLFIINLVIINFTNLSMATTAISVVIAIVFNKIYIPEVRKRVQKIKQKNPDKSLTELKEICAKKL